jgi:hypothetical protein
MILSSPRSLQHHSGTWNIRFLNTIFPYLAIDSDEQWSIGGFDFDTPRGDPA